MKKIFFAISILSSLWVNAQTEAIYIEHFGPEDAPIPTFFIIKDSNAVDVFVERHRSIVLGVNYSSTKDYELLDQLFYQELTDSIGNGKTPIWANMKITSYDTDFNILYERYICCGDESAKIFRKLLEIKSVSENKFICKLFTDFIYFIEEGMKH